MLGSVLTGCVLTGCVSVYNLCGIHLSNVAGCTSPVLLVSSTETTLYS